MRPSTCSQNRRLSHATLYEAAYRHSSTILLYGGLRSFGIFRKIKQRLGLLDERHAIFELSKGKHALPVLAGRVLDLPALAEIGRDLGREASTCGRRRSS